MRVGETVEAKRDIGSVFNRVSRGDVGVIVEVGYFGGYTVDFGDGHVIHNVTGDAVRPVAAAGPLGTGCLTSLTASLTAVSVVGVVLSRLRRSGRP